MGQNSLTGPIPSEVGLLTSPVHLDLEAALLTGAIPLEVGGLISHNLSNFNIPNSSLTGAVPSELCDLNQPCLCLKWKGGFETCQFTFDCTENLFGCECECPLEKDDRTNNDPNYFYVTT